jgi:hypothetical protein
VHTGWHQVGRAVAGGGARRELDLEEKFKELEATSYEELCTMIKQQQHLPTGVYDKLLAKIYKRAK